MWAANNQLPLLPFFVLPGLAWSPVMTSYISTMGRTPSAPCWVVSMAQTFRIASRAAPTRSSWLSAVMLPSAAMDLFCSTQVGTSLVREMTWKNSIWLIGQSYQTTGNLDFWVCLHVEEFFPFSSLGFSTKQWILNSLWGFIPKTIHVLKFFLWRS